MPHIITSGADYRKVITEIIIHAEIKFSEEYHMSSKSTSKLYDIENKLVAIISEYFEAIESEQCSNFEYKTRTQ